MRENIWKNLKLGFKANKLAIVGMIAIILLALISVFAFLYPVDPNAISMERQLAPCAAHPFGTDEMDEIIWQGVFTAEGHLFWLDSFLCWFLPVSVLLSDLLVVLWGGL